MLKNLRRLHRDLLKTPVLEKMERHPSDRFLGIWKRELEQGQLDDTPNEVPGTTFGNHSETCPKDGITSFVVQLRFLSMRFLDGTCERDSDLSQSRLCRNQFQEDVINPLLDLLGKFVESILVGQEGTGRVSSFLKRMIQVR